MPLTAANGIELFYEETGSPDDPALLLIMGYTAQLTMWPDAFCDILAAEGFRVLRFDNRDAGLSTKTEAPLPQLVPKTDPTAAGPAFSTAEPPPYTLDDMAADAVGLLDALGIERAHVVGASMGGMIAQTLAINHPERVLTLTSIMSSTGNPEVGQATPEALGGLMTPVPPERDAVIDRQAEIGKIIQGPLYDEAATREYAASAFDRSFHPVGALFQMAAIMASGDRTEKLRSLTCPTLVIHGAEDPLIQPSGGEATAAAIPGARLVVLDEMGHHLSPPLWAEIVAAIVDNTRRVAS